MIATFLLPYGLIASGLGTAFPGTTAAAARLDPEPLIPALWARGLVCLLNNFRCGWRLWRW